ncbi:hypothetical protein F5Y05DRAFT_424056 [Hypoxylon sp. FL0543]|nr:hypothetical protein F5Y05DRAFT_424056 [Hypoxylon sp. FL0543]
MSSQEYHGLAANFLELKKMRKLPVDSEERRRNIVARCNWYMFSSPAIRGKQFDDNYDYVLLCHSTAGTCTKEQERPNEEIAANPPTEAFLEKYHKPFPENTLGWLAGQDFVSANFIHATLMDAWGKWKSVSTKAKQLAEAIDSIPKPERVNKVVCLGLGPVLRPTRRDTMLPFGPENIGNRIMPRNIAQHLAAVAIVKQLERKTGQNILLYTADPEYSAQHKVALETLPIRPFIVLDPSYGKHEPFTVIDDNTLVICMAGAPECPAMRIIEEYARPVAFIAAEVPRTGKFQDRLWFEVTEEGGHKVQVPGCADLPLPDGCLDIGDLCPKRVRDMFAHEYSIESKFPAEEPRKEEKWGASDLVDYRGRHTMNAAPGAYWFSDTRLYVRKHGLARLLGGF